MKAKRLGIFPNMSKDKVHIALPEFVAMCRDWGLEPLLPEDVASDFGCQGFNKENITFMHNNEYFFLPWCLNNGFDESPGLIF